MDRDHREPSPNDETVDGSPVETHSVAGSSMDAVHTTGGNARDGEHPNQRHTVFAMSGILSVLLVSMAWVLVSECLREDSVSHYIVGRHIVHGTVEKEATTTPLPVTSPTLDPVLDTHPGYPVCNVPTQPSKHPSPVSPDQQSEEQTQPPGIPGTHHHDE